LALRLEVEAMQRTEDVAGHAFMSAFRSAEIGAEGAAGRDTW
jgi:hypothetical protein